MKLLSILKELNDTDVQEVKSRLTQLLIPFRLRFVLTNHAAFDRLIRDKSRQNITKEDIIHTVEAFVKKCADGDNNYARKIGAYKREKREIEGLITNLNNNLRIIFAIDFHHPPSSNGFNNFKIITTIVADDFRTDNFGHTEKFFIR